MSSKVYLERFSGDGKPPRRFYLDTYPVIIGRHEECNLRLNIGRLSRRHACIDRVDDKLTICDLGSTNGTFVNHQRIKSATVIDNGDVVHLADHEFRLVRELVDNEQQPQNIDSTVIGIRSLPAHFPTQVREFENLLEQELVSGFYQVITDNRGTPFAAELLGRSNHPALQIGPGGLFSLASALGKASELSELFRRVCFADAAAQKFTQPLFFNTHPSESAKPERLLKVLGELRVQYPDLDLVFEVHESAVTNIDAMKKMRAALRDLDIRLAYDDFGSGQARLVELAEVSPDFIKFDISLVADVVDTRSPKYKMLSMLNSLAKEYGATTLAEGVENQECAAACAEIGIDLIQGFLYSIPGPIIPPEP